MEKFPMKYNKRKLYQAKTGRCRNGDFQKLMDTLIRHTPESPVFLSGNLLTHNQGNGSGQCFQSQRPGQPGITSVSLFPVDAMEKTNMVFALEAAGVRLFSNGGEYIPRWLPEERTWSPWKVEDAFEAGNLRVRQSTAILAGGGADAIGCLLEWEGGPEGLDIEISCRLFDKAAVSSAGEDEFYGVVEESNSTLKYKAVGPWQIWYGTPPKDRGLGAAFRLSSGIVPEKTDLFGEPENTLKIRGKAKKRLFMIFAAGLEENEVKKVFRKAKKMTPELFFAHARKRFEDFFRRSVPGFSCSDSQLERVYAELNLSGFLATYDCPYGSFRHPIAVPAAKLVPEWRHQFTHDSSLAATAFLWLNDAERCKQELLQMFDSPVNSLPDLRESEVPAALTFAPHLNFLGRISWKIYCRTNDRKFLEKALNVLLEYDRRKCRAPKQAGFEFSEEEHPPYSFCFPYRHYDRNNDGLLSADFAGDDTCRADEFRSSDKPKNWWEQADIKMDPADANFYALENRLRMRDMAEELNHPQIAAELDGVIDRHRKAIEKYLWVEEEKRYADVADSDYRRGKVREVQNITVPLAGKCVSPDRAEEIIEDLLNPDIFWTPLPCPTCPLNYPGTGRKSGFDPDGYWRGRTWGLMLQEAMHGLDHYGHGKEAARLLHSVLKALGRSMIPAPENFNPLTGAGEGTPFMGFSASLLDCVIPFIAGIRLRSDELLEFNPTALDPEWENFSFGPYQYRKDIVIQVSWTKKNGFSVRVNRQKFHFEKPMAFLLAKCGGKYQPIKNSVRSISFQAECPIEISFGTGLLILKNKRQETQKATLLLRQWIKDEPLKKISEERIVLKPAERAIRTVSEKNLLASIQLEGNPVPFVYFQK